MSAFEGKADVAENTSVGGSVVVRLTAAAPENLALPPPPIKVPADRAPHDELPVTLDDAVPGRTRVKLCLLHS